MPLILVQYPERQAFFPLEFGPTPLPFPPQLAHIRFFIFTCLTLLLFLGVVPGVFLANY